MQSTWIDRPMVRLITIGIIYLLGVIAVTVIQIGSSPLSIRILPVVFFLLPLGWIEGALQSLPTLGQSSDHVATTYSRG